MNYRFHLRSNWLNKKGLAALYFIIEDTRPVWVSTHLYLTPKHWNQEQQLPTK